MNRDLLAGGTVMLGAHGNSLRALVKHLDGISDAAERNIFGYGSRGVLIASRAGSGDANLVVGNWFGVDTTGEPGDLDTGRVRPGLGRPRQRPDRRRHQPVP